VVAAVEVPVTLKIRTGLTPESRNALTVAHIAEDAGIQALAVHGRPRSQKYAGCAEYDTIAAVKAGFRFRCSPTATSIRPSRHARCSTTRKPTR
jgi:tRNA-dihydrouridine synthase B